MHWHYQPISRYAALTTDPNTDPDLKPKFFTTFAQTVHLLQLNKHIASDVIILRM